MRRLRQQVGTYCAQGRNATGRVAVDLDLDANYPSKLSRDKVVPMTGNVLARMRSFIIRGLAVLAVIVTYAVTSLGTQVASLVGVSTLALTTMTATPAEAQYWRRRRYVRRRYVRRWRRW
jgi:hypothetical protein